MESLDKLKIAFLSGALRLCHGQSEGHHGNHKQGW